MTLCNRHRDCKVVSTEDDCQMCWLYEQIDSYRNTVKRLRKQKNELRMEVDIGQDRERKLQIQVDDLVDPPIDEPRPPEDMPARHGMKRRKNRD